METLLEEEVEEEEDNLIDLTGAEEISYPVKKKRRIESLSRFPFHRETHGLRGKLLSRKARIKKLDHAVYSNDIGKARIIVDTGIQASESNFRSCSSFFMFEVLFSSNPDPPAEAAVSMCLFEEPFWEKGLMQQWLRSVIQNNKRGQETSEERLKRSLSGVSRATLYENMLVTYFTKNVCRRDFSSSLKERICLLHQALKVAKTCSPDTIAHCLLQDFYFGSLKMDDVFLFCSWTKIRFPLEYLNWDAALPLFRRVPSLFVIRNICELWISLLTSGSNVTFDWIVELVRHRVETNRYAILAALLYGLPEDLTAKIVCLCPGASLKDKLMHLYEPLISWWSFIKDPPELDDVTMSVLKTFSGPPVLLSQIVSPLLSEEDKQAWEFVSPVAPTSSSSGIMTVDTLSSWSFDSVYQIRLDNTSSRLLHALLEVAPKKSKSVLMIPRIKEAKEPSGPVKIVDLLALGKRLNDLRYTRNKLIVTSLFDFQTFRIPRYILERLHHFIYHDLVGMRTIEQETFGRIMRLHWKKQLDEQFETSVLPVEIENHILSFLTA